MNGDARRKRQAHSLESARARTCLTVFVHTKCEGFAPKTYHRFLLLTSPSACSHGKVGYNFIPPQSEVGAWTSLLFGPSVSSLLCIYYLSLPVEFHLYPQRPATQSCKVHHTMLRHFARHPSRRCPLLQLWRRQSSLAVAEGIVGLGRSITISSQRNEFGAMKALMDTLQVAVVVPYEHLCPLRIERPQQQRQTTFPTAAQLSTQVGCSDDLPSISEAPESPCAIFHHEQLEQVSIEARSSVKAAVVAKEIPNEYHDGETRLPVEQEQQVKQAPRGVSNLIILDIQNSMDRNDPDAAYQGIIKAWKHGIVLSKPRLYNCFRFMVTRNPVLAHYLLMLYEEKYSTDIDMYERLCRSVAHLKSHHALPPQTKDCVALLRRTFRDMPREAQQRLLPILLESVMTTEIASVRMQGYNLTTYILQYNFQLEPDLLERLLSMAQSHNIHELPYHILVRKLADWQTAPNNPAAVPCVLTSFFPFTDFERTLVAVQATLDMALRGNANVKVDMGTLEMIMASAARFGKHELGLLTWDLSECMGYEPTESLFESMIQAFSMSYRQDHRAFACLAEMEQHGYVPSRALLRSISRSLKFSISRIDNAYRILTSRNSGSQPTLYSLNVIMSACAENGDVDRTFSVLNDDFRAYGIEPNEDSFSFALEALAVNVRNGQDLNHLATADKLLDLMEEKELQINHHVFHQYIRVALNSGNVEMATASTLDAIKTKGFEVSDRTIVLLVYVLGARGDFDMARKFTGLTKDTCTYLHAKIDCWERDRAPHQDLGDQVHDSEISGPLT